MRNDIIFECPERHKVRVQHVSDGVWAVSCDPNCPYCVNATFAISTICDEYDDETIELTLRDATNVLSKMRSNSE